MLKYLVLVFPLVGCTSLTGFKEEHALLHKANKAEVRMDKALAMQGTGTALVAKGKLDYSDAKLERDVTLKELADLLVDSTE